MNYTYATYTSPGGRLNNEDAVRVLDEKRKAAFVLADGLGGHGFGEVASEIAVNAVCEAFAVLRKLTAGEAARCIEAANKAILRTQTESASLKNMRSTVAALFIDGANAFGANVGDSRLYHFKAGSIALISKDHSVAAVSARIGEMKEANIRFHPDRNRLTRVLGNSEQARPEIYPIFLSKGDAVLLCSDGFWEYIRETEMEIDLAKSANPDEWMNYMLVRILNQVIENHDNLSAITIMF